MWPIILVKEVTSNRRSLPIRWWPSFPIMTSLCSAILFPPNRAPICLGDRNVQPRRSIPWHCRSEEHTSELQSRLHLVCRLLLEKKKKHKTRITDEIDTVSP